MGKGSASLHSHYLQSEDADVYTERVFGSDQGRNGHLRMYHDFYIGLLLVDFMDIKSLYLRYNVMKNPFKLFVYLDSLGGLPLLEGKELLPSNDKYDFENYLRIPLGDKIGKRNIYFKVLATQSDPKSMVKIDWIKFEK